MGSEARLGPVSELKSVGLGDQLGVETETMGKGGGGQR